MNYELGFFKRLGKYGFGAIALLLTLLSCKKTINESAKPVEVDKIDFPAAYVINGWDNSVSVINLAENSVKKLIQLKEAGKFPHHINLSPDGSKLVVAIPEFDFTLSHDLVHSNTNLKGGFTVLDAVTGKILNQTIIERANHNAVFSPNGKEIWTATMIHGANMYIYDAETYNLIKTIPLDADPSEVVFSKNKRYAFVAPMESSFIHVIDVERKLRVKDIKVDIFPTNVWAGADGKIYVENKTQKTINVINADNLSVESAINLDFKPGFIAYNTSNNELWVCKATDNKVAYFMKNGSEWKKQGEIQTDLDAHAIAFTKNQEIAYVVNQQGNTVSVVDVKTHTKIKDLKVGSKPNGIVLKE